MVWKKVILLIVLSSIYVWSLAGCGQDDSVPVDSQIATDRVILTFEWTPPQDGAVDNYLVSISENDGPFVPAPERVAQTHYSFPAEDGYSYRVEVQAFNEFGAGTPSDPSEKVAVHQGQVVLDP